MRIHIFAIITLTVSSLAMETSEKKRDWIVDIREEINPINIMAPIPKRSISSWLGSYWNSTTATPQPKEPHTISENTSVLKNALETAAEDDNIPEILKLLNTIQMAAHKMNNLTLNEAVGYNQDIKEQTKNNKYLTAAAGVIQLGFILYFSFFKESCS